MLLHRVFFFVFSPIRCCGVSQVLCSFMGVSLVVLVLFDWMLCCVLGCYLTCVVQLDGVLPQKVLCCFIGCLMIHWVLCCFRLCCVVSGSVVWFQSTDVPGQQLWGCCSWVVSSSVVSGH